MRKFSDENKATELPLNFAFLRETTGFNLVISEKKTFYALVTSFSKKSRHVVTSSKVKLVGVRAIWQETVESNRELNRGNLTEIKQR